MSAFDRAFDLVIGAEGGYVNDPRDPGGETQFGISKRAYPGVDIKALTLDDAREIYRRDYWDAAQCERLPEPLAILLFDAAVNMGTRPATGILQRALGVPDDGILGNLTMAAIHALDADDLAVKFCTERALRYMGLRNFDIYGRGWLRRVFHLARVA